MLYVENEISHHWNCMQLKLGYQNVKSCHICILDGSGSYWCIPEVNTTLNSSCSEINSQ